MQYLQKSFLPQQLRTKFNEPWTIDRVIGYILTETKYFIAVDTKSLLSESKTEFTNKGQKFMMIEVEEIELLKKYSDDIIHFILNKGSYPVKITISLSSFNNSGLYMDLRLAAEDIKIIMDEYDKRRATYQHNLNQTNKGIKLLMKASAGILDSYPEKFI